MIFQTASFYTGTRTGVLIHYVIGGGDNNDDCELLIAVMVLDILCV